MRTLTRRGALARGAGLALGDLSVTTGEEYPVAYPDQRQFKYIPLTWFKRRRGPTGVSGGVRKVQAQQAGIVRAFAFTQRGAAAVADGPPLQL
jgi:hypothetical protein